MPDLFHFNQIFARKAGRVIGKAYRKATEQYNEVKASGAYYSVRKPFEDMYLFLANKHFLYRRAVHDIHKTVHPFTAEGTWQTATDVADTLYKSIVSIEKQLIWTKAAGRSDQVGIGPINPAAAADSMDVETHFKLNKQIPDIIKGIETWQDWTKERLEIFIRVRFTNFTEKDALRDYLLHCLLPWLYWQEILGRTPRKERNRRLRADYEKISAQSTQSYVEHPLTASLNTEQMQTCINWGDSIVRSFQRSSSQVEGRNGYLAFIHKANRGIPAERLKVLSVIYNFDTRRADGSTPAQRLFERDFPDLFENILQNVTGFKEPRKRSATT